MTIKIESDFIYFQAAEAQAKQLDAIYVKSRKAYKLPNTIGALRELHKLGFDVMEYGYKKSQYRKTFLEMKQEENPALYLDQSLRPYQRIDISFLSQLPNGGIFSEQRTGKSAVALKLLELEENGKHLIVCPSSLVLTWANESKKWTSLTPFPVSGDKRKRMKTYQTFKEATEGILIMSKDTLRQDVDTLETL